MKKEIVTEVIVCNICGKELKGTEAKTINITVGGDEYYDFHLCHTHWGSLAERLNEIQSSTSTAKRVE